ncbi:serine/threonine protein kinase (plasmid) [Chondrocystis sp. NIES-4102]|nr:serine/threonine protein kinase [Chondrocystis sp. NIES-4102]
METLGNYQIVNYIQNFFEGGKRTCIAKDKNGKKVVIKQLCFAINNSNWSGYKALEKEIKALKSLEHPYIPRYIESFESELGSCLVSEYIEGEDLSKQTLKLDEIEKLLTSILEILVYLQSKDPIIIHRDIKPQNIIRGKNGEYYLIDFGLAIESDKSLSLSSTLSGTIGFMPPEVLRGLKLGKSADLYSLGMAIYSLLSGKSGDRISKSLSSDFTINTKDIEKKIDKQFLNWLKTCLNHNPSKRFSSAKQALKYLKSIKVKDAPVKKSMK